MSSEKREEATVDNVFYGKEDHGILTCTVGLLLGPTGGAYQAFGGLSLTPETGADFKAELCAFFGRSFDALKGAKCYTLRSFSGWNEPIEGLELENGKRFVLTAWRRKHWPATESRLDARKKSIQGEIEWLTRRIREETAKLAELEADYTEWS